MPSGWARWAEWRAKCFFGMFIPLLIIFGTFVTRMIVARIERRNAREAFHGKRPAGQTHFGRASAQPTGATGRRSREELK